LNQFKLGKRLIVLHTYDQRSAQAAEMFEVLLV